MKTMLILINLLVATIVLSNAEPLKKYKNHNTNYNYYYNKYNDIWELKDSSVILKDTIYTYRMGGIYYRFNQNGLLLNN